MLSTQFLGLRPDDVLTLDLAVANVRGGIDVVDNKGGDEEARAANDAEEGVYLLGWEREGGRGWDDVRWVREERGTKNKRGEGIKE